MVSEEDKNQPKAWLCKHCNERVDPTMALCWSCGHDREGKPLEDFDTDETMPFTRCPQCQYDLRGNLEALACPECGTQLMMSNEQKQLYWVPAATNLGSVARLLRNPLRMISVAIFAWLFVGIAYLANEETYLFHGRYDADDPADWFLLLTLSLALFFTFAVTSGVLVQGLQPPDDDRVQPSISSSAPFVLKWMKQGWGRYLYWIAWGALLLGILVFYANAS